MVAAEPTFGHLMRYARRLGAEDRRVPLNEDHAHDLEALADRARGSDVGLTVVCNPANPTGTIVPGAALAGFCEEVSRRTVVLVDEAYHELVTDPEHRSTTALVRAGNDVVVSRTFSKIYGLAGMRVGYGLARPELADRIRAWLDHAVGPVSLAAARRSLADESWVDESRRKILRARAVLTHWLDEAGVPRASSEANFVWFRVGPEGRDLPLELAERGLHVTWTPRRLSSDWMRVSVGTVEEMVRTVAALRADRG